MATNRVADLISAFQRSNGVDVLQSTTVMQDDVSEKEIVSLLDQKTFLYANVSENRMFRNKSASELTSLSGIFYKRYSGTSDAYEKITLALLLYRVFSFYLPNVKSLLSVGTISYTIIKAIEDQHYQHALDQLSESILSPEDVCESALKGIGMAFYGRAFQLLEQQVQHCIRKRKPGLFENFEVQKYQPKVPEKFSTTTEIIRMPVRIELTSCVGSDIFFLSMTRPE
jgi:hypothetical protein